MRPKPDDLIGNKYRIVRLIGDGGMGVVYEARHEVLGSSVALKFLHSDLAKRPGLSARFLREAKVSATIQSPHVARVSDVDTVLDGSPYLVMELLPGETLQSLLDRETKLPADQAVDFSLQILSGLEAAHALEVVHRDLKPDNVFITESAGGPIVKLIDFGIAKIKASSEYTKGLTRAGVLMGTPEYMAPEQLYAADKVDHRADIYSIGAMLYEMLSGKRPVDAEEAEVIVARVAAGEVRPLAEVVPDVDPELASVVSKAMSLDKAQRFDSARQMRLALAKCAGELSHAGRLAALGAVPFPARARPSGAPAEPSTGDQGISKVQEQEAGPRTGTLPPEEPPPSDKSGPEQPVHAHGVEISPVSVRAATPDIAALASARPATPRMEQAPASIRAGELGPSTRLDPPLMVTVGDDLPQPFAGSGTEHAAPPLIAKPPMGAVEIPGQWQPPYGAAPRHPSSQFPAHSAFGIPLPRRKRTWGALLAVLALLLGAALAAFVIMAIAMSRREDNELAPLSPSSEPLPPATISAQGESEISSVGAHPPNVGSPQAAPTAGRATTTQSGTNRPGSDAGAGTPDAGLFPFAPFVLPSGLPIPTMLPSGLPSGFPQFPGVFPAPPSSRKVKPRDAGP